MGVPANCVQHNTSCENAHTRALPTFDHSPCHRGDNVPVLTAPGATNGVPPAASPTPQVFRRKTRTDRRAPAHHTEPRGSECVTLRQTGELDQPCNRGWLHNKQHAASDTTGRLLTLLSLTAVQHLPRHRHTERLVGEPFTIRFRLPGWERISEWLWVARMETPPTTVAIMLLFGHRMM
jgi:hypothetical protein